MSFRHVCLCLFADLEKIRLNLLNLEGLHAFTFIYNTVAQIIYLLAHLFLFAQRQIQSAMKIGRFILEEREN